MDENFSTAHIAVSYHNCVNVEGPLYHGTKSVLEGGCELVPGYGSNFQKGRVSNHIYFSALVETTAWGAELASALGNSGERGRLYVVEPARRVRGRPECDQQTVPG